MAPPFYLFVRNRGDGMTSKARRVGARRGLSAKKSTKEKLDDLRNGKVEGLGKPTKPTDTQSPDPKPEPRSTPSDCGGWGGVSNQKTNSRGGRRGR
jgi:hypothetical protein